MSETIRHSRHVGEDRDALAAALKTAYEQGATIRDLADEHQMSYGKIHRILSESGVDLRGRGGRQAGRLSRPQIYEYQQRLHARRAK